MQYSPKLKIAIGEIKEILKKHDIAGFVALHTPGFTEYLNHVEASYSCASIADGGIRFKLKTAEVGKERAKEIADGTYNMITHFSDILASHAMLYMQAHDMLKEKWNGEDGKGNHTSHDQQNN